MQTTVRRIFSISPKIILKTVLFFKLFFEILLSIIYFISGFIPKDKNLWIFGSYHNKYLDNSKFFFEYILNHHPEIQAVWLTSNDRIFRKLKGKGLKVFKKYSVKGFLYSFRAGVVLLSSYRNNVNPYAIRNAFVVNAWHGVPLKTIEYDIPPQYANDFYKRRRLFDKLSILFPRFNMSYNLITASSSKVKEIFIKAFKIDSDKIAVTGDPRMDVLFGDKNRLVSEDTLFYLPTFRSFGSIDYFSYEFHPEEWQKFLVKHNLILKVKFHPNEKAMENKYQTQFQAYDKIQFLSRDDDLYSMLKSMKILLTDFSSIMFDAAAIRKPVLFLPFEMEMYISRERPLYFDYQKQITGNYSFRNWKELLNYLKSNLHKQYRLSKFLVEFHSFSDDKNSKRVYEEIMRRLFKNAL